MAQGLQYSTSITATSSGGSVSFAVPGATGIELKATSVVVWNDGTSSDVYFNFTSTTGATTGDHPVKTLEYLSINAPSRKGYYTGLSYVTSTSGGASVACRVFAYR